MCTEFWVGWFDHWGNGGHMTGNLEESVKDLDKMLELGHVNIYMFEGGTNFGFMNGSNYYDELTPDVTSYDYDALLTEDGQITENTADTATSLQIQRDTGSYIYDRDQKKGIWNTASKRKGKPVFSAG